MLGGERWRVLEVHRHRSQENRRAGAPAQRDDGRQIAREILIHDAQARAVAADLVLQEQLHPLPLLRVG